MFSIYLIAFLISISPFGESRLGIVAAFASAREQGLEANPFLVFTVCLIANLLVFPIFKALIDKFNSKLWKWRPYKRQAVKLSQRSKRLVGKHIKKYGFWGLMIFVMIPLPITGAYMGTIAAVIFNLPHKQSLYSITIGVTISCVIVTAVSYLGISFTTF